MFDHSPLPRLSLFFGVALVAAFASSEAQAQQCREPLCGAGDTFSGSGTDSSGTTYGVCRGCNWFGYCSHQISYCPSGRTLDTSTGECVLDACTGSGGCGALVDLCDPDEVYSTGGTDSTGPYGICANVPSPPLWYRYHRIARCEEGWELQTSTGKCRKTCNYPPDLWIRRAFLKNRYGTAVSSVPAYQPYYVCFEVTNIGLGTSNNFVVRGGALGVSTPPQQTHYRLRPGERREGCLYYQYTPYPATWTVQLMVDATHTNTESNERNNTRNVSVTIY